jgi:hypothetical protein
MRTSGVTAKPVWDGLIGDIANTIESDGSISMHSIFMHRKMTAMDRQKELLISVPGYADCGVCSRSAVPTAEFLGAHLCHDSA